MKIQTLKLHNYRIFENIDLEFDPHYSLIVGVNGAGKTSILEGTAIAIGTILSAFTGDYKYGIEKTDAHLTYYKLGEGLDIHAQYPVSISAIGDVDGNTVNWERVKMTVNGKTRVDNATEMTDISKLYLERVQAGDSTLILPILAYYSTDRLRGSLRNIRESKMTLNNRTKGYADCLDGSTSVKLMREWFQKMTIQKYQRMENGYHEQPELQAVYTAMEDCLTLFSGYRDTKIQFNLDASDLEVYYLDQDNCRKAMLLSLLSDGFKEIISIVGDIAYRMAVLNPQLQKDILQETDGIVLIDEVDLHLHPAWQQKIMKTLTTIFPKVQFIVTTHAPAVINSVDRDHLIILRDGIPTSASSQTYGKDVNSVLKEIMGAEERPYEVSELFDQFYELLNKKKYDSAGEILDQLDLLRDFHDPEVANCRVKLKLERIRGGQK